MTERHFPWPQISDNWEQSDNCNNWIWRLYIHFRNNRKALLYKLQSIYQISFRVGGYNGSNLLVHVVLLNVILVLGCWWFPLDLTLNLSPLDCLLLLLLLVIVVLLISSVFSIFFFFFKQTCRLKIKEWDKSEYWVYMLKTSEDRG